MNLWLGFRFGLGHGRLRNIQTRMTNGGTVRATPCGWRGTNVPHSLASVASALRVRDPRALSIIVRAKVFDLERSEVVQYR